MFWAIVGGCVSLGLTVWAVAGFLGGSNAPDSAASANAATAPGQHKPNAVPAGADTKTRMQAAQEYVDRKDYAMAEDLYKQVISAEPKNAEALTKLASVLYREDKIDESVSILDRIPKN